MPIRAVIFDLGGVLIRNVDESGRRKWGIRLGLGEKGIWEAIDRTGLANAARLGEVPGSVLWQQLGLLYGLDDEQLRELEHDYRSGDEINIELVQFLQGLRPRYKTATLSNAWLGAREAVSKRFKFEEIMDTMLFSAEERLAKPDARFYQLALERLGVQAQESVYLDDKPRNVEAARLLGMRGIQFEDNAQAIAEIQRCLND